MAQSENETILAAALDIGEQILICGGEVSRVEDTIRRICTAYGSERTDVFCITSSIVVTMARNDAVVSQTRRIEGTHTDFSRLEQLNALSREICSTNVSPEEARKKTAEITNRKEQPLLMSALGYMIAAGGFAVFFGGTITDGVCAAAASVFILLFDKAAKPILKSNLIWTLLCAFFTGLIAVLCQKMNLCNDAGKVIIGAIMVLIPGISITNALHDLMSGNTISGLLRLMEALLCAGILAVGFFGAMVIGR